MPLSADQARATYERMSATLDRLERFEARAKALGLAWLALQPGEQVVELGVGTGGVTVRLLEQVGPVGRVDGIDIAVHLIDRTRARAEAAGLSAGLHLHRAPASATELPSAATDALFSSYLLDLLPAAEIDATLREAFRLLRPGGRAVFVGITPGCSWLGRTISFLWGTAHALRPVLTGG